MRTYVFSVAMLLVHGLAYGQHSTDTNVGSVIEHNKIYKFVNQFSGKCMDVANHSQDEGATVQQWDCHNGGNQKWKAISAYKHGWILEGVESGLRLLIADANMENGAPLVSGGYASGNNGYFQFRPTATTGIYYIAAGHSVKCLDIVGRSRYNGARIQQSTCADTNASQQWKALVQ